MSAELVKLLLDALQLLVELEELGMCEFGVHVLRLRLQVLRRITKLLLTNLTRHAEPELKHCVGDL